MKTREMMCKETHVTTYVKCYYGNLLKCTIFEMLQGSLSVTANVNSAR